MMEQRAESLEGPLEKDQLSTSTKNRVQKLRELQALANLEVRPSANAMPNDPAHSHFKIIYSDNISAKEKEFAEIVFRDSWSRNSDAPDWQKLKSGVGDRVGEASLWKDTYQPRLHQQLAQTLHKVRAKAKMDYELLLAAQPFASYLPNADPSTAEIMAARRKYSDDLNTQRTVLLKTRVKNPNARVLALFGPAARQVLEKNPEDCFAYQALLADIEEDLKKSGLNPAEAGACLYGVVNWAAAGVCAGATVAKGVDALNQNERSWIAEPGRLFGDRSDPMSARRSADYKEASREAALEAAVGATVIIPVGRAAKAIFGVEKSAALEAKAADDVVREIDDITNASINKPYKHSLGEGENGVVAKQPRVCLNEFDCTQSVEMITAQSLAKVSGKNFENVADDIRYFRGKDGPKISYVARKHLAEDWIEKNIEYGHYKDATHEIGGAQTRTVTQSIDRGITLRGLSEKNDPRLNRLIAAGEKIPLATKSVDYIPTAELLNNSALLSRIPSGSVFNVVRNSTTWDGGYRGTVISHQGFIIRKADGKLYLRHASARKDDKKFLEISLEEYMTRYKDSQSIVGLNVLRITPSAP